MKNISKPTYYCKSCNKEITTNDKICPYCGSNKRIINLSISETIVLRDSLTTRKFHQGFKEWVLEIMSGWFPSIDKAKHPKGVKKIRVIDRENPESIDSYQEKITDIKTGKIFRDVKEPLKMHKIKKQI